MTSPAPPTPYVRWEIPPPADGTLRTAELVTFGRQCRNPVPARRAIGRVHYWPPTIQPAAAADLPSRTEDAQDESHTGGHAAVQVMFELESWSTRSRFVAAFLRVHFDDPRVTAVDLQITMVRRNAATPVTGDVPLTSVSVLRNGGFGWLFGDPEGTAPIPPTCGGYALISVPAGTDAITGTVRVDATVTSPLFWFPGLPGVRREHARITSAPEFSMRPPGNARKKADGPLAVVEQPTVTLRPAVRLCLAADMEQFSRFHTPEATRAQQRFADALTLARRYAGLDDAAVQLQQTGDGQFAILPPGLDETVVIPQLIDGLRIALAQTNSDLSNHARLRLRVALHRGHMAPASNGWVGAATIAVHRILDSDAARSALRSTPAASFVLIVADVLYQEVIVHRYSLLDPDDFTEVNVELPAKNFAERAWVYVPTS